MRKDGILGMKLYNGETYLEKRAPADKQRAKGREPIPPEARSQSGTQLLSDVLLPLRLSAGAPSLHIARQEADKPRADGGGISEEKRPEGRAQGRGHGG